MWSFLCLTFPCFNENWVFAVHRILSPGLYYRKSQEETHIQVTILTHSTFDDSEKIFGDSETQRPNSKSRQPGNGGLPRRTGSQCV